MKTTFSTFACVAAMALISSFPATAAKTAAQTVEVAMVAGGCFWGVEDLFRKLSGVKETETGYTGGFIPEATYDRVKKGKTGHAEAVRIVFDPTKISYEQLLNYFFKIHDPTTLNRQGNDTGTQYRSAIFYLSEGQKKTAEMVRAKVDATGFWKGRVITEIVAAGEFYRAEDYHQKYLMKNPGGYTCHYERPFIFGK